MPLNLVQVDNLLVTDSSGPFTVQDGSGALSDTRLFNLTNNSNEDVFSAGLDEIFTTIPILGATGDDASGGSPGTAGNDVTVTGGTGGAGGATAGETSGDGGDLLLDAGPAGANGGQGVGTAGSITIGGTNATGIDLAAPVTGGLTLTGTGITMTGLDIGSASAEIGNVYLADEKIVYLGSAQEGLIYFDADGSGNPFSAPALTITTTGEITTPSNLGTPLWLSAADASTTDYAGGSIQIRSGAGTTTPTTGDGGSIQIVSGSGGTTANGGIVQVSAGAGGSTSGAGGNAEFLGGSAATSGDGGDSRLYAGNAAGASGLGGQAEVVGGDGAGSGKGGGVDIIAGPGGATGVGGDVTIQAGDSTVTRGTIYIGNDNTAAVSIGGATENTTITQVGTGQVTLLGNVNATAGLDVTGADLTTGSGINLAMAALTGTTATDGFLGIPTVSGAPSNTPTIGNGAMALNTSTGDVYVYNGSWGTVGGGGGSTLSATYAAGSSATDSQMTLDSTRQGIIIKDNATDLTTDLFRIEANTATVDQDRYFRVRGAGQTNANVEINGYLESDVDIPFHVLGNHTSTMTGTAYNDPGGAARIETVRSTPLLTNQWIAAVSARNPGNSSDPSGSKRVGVHVMTRPFTTRLGNATAYGVFVGPNHDVGLFASARLTTPEIAIQGKANTGTVEVSYTATTPSLSGKAIALHAVADNGTSTVGLLMDGVGSDILWDTDGQADIGTSAGNRPAQIHARDKFQMGTTGFMVTDAFADMGSSGLSGIYKSDSANQYTRLFGPYAGGTGLTAGTNDILLTAGRYLDATNTSGSVRLYGGEGSPGTTRYSAGGAIQLTGGRATANSGMTVNAGAVGGAVTITAGVSAARAGTGSGQIAAAGADISITASNAAWAGADETLIQANGGDITVTSGNSVGAGDAGDFNVVLGTAGVDPSTTHRGGSMNVQCGGLNGSATGGTGGSVTIELGDGLDRRHGVFMVAGANMFGNLNVGAAGAYAASGASPNSGMADSLGPISLNWAHEETGGSGFGYFWQMGYRAHLQTVGNLTDSYADEQIVAAYAGNMPGLNNEAAHKLTQRVHFAASVQTGTTNRASSPLGVQVTTRTAFGAIHDTSSAVNLDYLLYGDSGVIRMTNLTALPPWNQVTSVKVRADVSDDLHGTYFNINIENGALTAQKFYVWYNTSGTPGSGDPAPAGRTGIEVAIVTNEPAVSVKTKTTSTLNAYNSGNTFSATNKSVSTGDQYVYIKNVNDAQSNPDAANVTAGFTVYTAQEGGMLANSGVIGLQDVSGVAELFYVDENGTQTQLTGTSRTLEATAYKMPTDGAGDIGETSDKRPANIYTQTKIEVASTLKLENQLVSSTATLKLAADKDSTTTLGESAAATTAAGSTDIVAPQGTATGTGGSVNITSGAGGATSGNSGDVNIDVGAITSGTQGVVNLGVTDASAINIGRSGQSLGFFGTTATTKPTVTGSRGGNAALASLLTSLANLGLITDSTTA